MNLYQHHGDNQFLLCESGVVFKSNELHSVGDFRGRAAKSLALACCAVLFTAGAMAAEAPSTLPNGMARVPGAKLDLVYAHPGTDLKKYRTIHLMPLSIPEKVRDARPNGRRPGLGESYVLRDREVEELQKVYSQVMRDRLGKAGFTFVDTPQADTLVVVVRVVDITLNAPIETTRRTYSNSGFVMSGGAGSMAIAAVLADGPTGKVLAEAADRSYPSDIWRVNNRVSNLADAKQIFGVWAQALRDRLTGG